MKHYFVLKISRSIAEEGMVNIPRRAAKALRYGDNTVYFVPQQDGVYLLLNEAEGEETKPDGASSGFMLNGWTLVLPEHCFDDARKLYLTWDGSHSRISTTPPDGERAKDLTQLWRYFLIVFQTIVLFSALLGVDYLIEGFSRRAPEEADEEACLMYTVRDESGQELRRNVFYTSDGAYLIDDESNRLAGPYPFISATDLTPLCRAVRYIRNSGRYGYLSPIDGHEITADAFYEATEMGRYDYCELVRDEGGSYYIDTDGQPISAKYAEAYPPERQGFYARVKTHDGKWAVIRLNKTGREAVLISGMDAISPLPSVTELGAGVRDGKVVIFAFPEGDGEITVIKEFDDLTAVEYQGGRFAEVTGKDGRKGLLFIGQEPWEMVFPAEYTAIERLDKIDCSNSDLYDNENKFGYVFRAEKPDGTCEIRHWSFFK